MGDQLEAFQRSIRMLVAHEEESRVKRMLGHWQSELEPTIFSRPETWSPPGSKGLAFDLNLPFGLGPVGADQPCLLLEDID